MRPVLGITSLAVLMLVLSPSLLAAEIFVDAKAAEGGNGAASTPYATLADALAATAPGDTITLAPGKYTFAAPKKSFDGKMVTVRAAKDAEGKVVVGHLDGSYSFVRFEVLVIPEAVRIRKARWV